MTHIITGSALDSLEALARMKERGSWSGWSGDHPCPSKSTWHTLYGSFYSMNPLIIILQAL